MRGDHRARSLIHEAEARPGALPAEAQEKDRRGPGATFRTKIPVYFVTLHKGFRSGVPAGLSNLLHGLAGACVRTRHASTRALPPPLASSRTDSRHEQGFEVGRQGEMMPKGTNVIDRLVGARVRLRRQALGMSQTELAQAIDLTFQQVQKYEQGKNRIGAGRLASIADVLRVPVSFFFEDLPAPEAPAAVEADAVAAALGERGAVQLVRAYAAIPDRRVRQRLLDLARALAGDVAEPEEAGEG